MILTSTLQDEAVMNNVGGMSDFKIKASAKSFQILSSGLYQNKIRAILRELGCNAVDSHVAAGTQNIPFEIHLPTLLQPWFSIRDFGIGLSHEDVCSVYTTYFESTKTNCNDFIGALGLGSKTPFSYTDNFTITAIKDGVRGIYTAIINDLGVPSVVHMVSEATSDRPGVEIKFAVQSQYDYGKFETEARGVYTHFSLKPVMSNNPEFAFSETTYYNKDIVPGVHSTNKRSSVAVMGNIAYPIDLPAADQSLGDLRTLLGHGLEIHFNIGELDFQASREGLSYIPLTVTAIKDKLTALNQQLVRHLEKEAEAFTNLWERANFLHKKKAEGLWAPAVKLYITTSQFPLIEDVSGYSNLKSLKFTCAELAEKFNIDVASLVKDRSYQAVKTSRPDTEYGPIQPDGSRQSIPVWSTRASPAVFFVITDTKTGARERAKFHWRTKSLDSGGYGTQTIYVLSKADKTKPMLTAEFFAALHNPPATQIFKASELTERVRETQSAKNVNIMQMKRQDSRSRNGREFGWCDAGTVDGFDSTRTYYYLPLRGYELIAISNHGVTPGELATLVHSCGIPQLANIEIYGVRKGDIESIVSQKNWVNLETYIQKTLTDLQDHIAVQLAYMAVDCPRAISYNRRVLGDVASDTSQYKSIVMKFKNATRSSSSVRGLNRLCSIYLGSTATFGAKIQSLTADLRRALSVYPLLRYTDSADDTHVAQYINLIDAQLTNKGN